MPEIRRLCLTRREPINILTTQEVLTNLALPRFIITPPFYYTTFYPFAPGSSFPFIEYHLCVDVMA
jgi:hypothetical protein